MGNAQVVRAWKGRRFREGLSAEQRSRLPENPAGAIDLPDEQLEGLSGRIQDGYLTQHGCLTMHTLACGSCGGTVLPRMA